MIGGQQPIEAIFKTISRPWPWITVDTQCAIPFDMGDT